VSQRKLPTGNLPFRRGKFPMLIQEHLSRHPYYFVHILLCGKSVPIYGRGHSLRVYKKVIISWILEQSFLTDSYGKFPHSRGKNVLEEERKKERLPCLSILFFLEYISGKFRKCQKSLILSTEPAFLMVYGAQESGGLRGMNSASLCSLAGRYDKHIPTQFLAPV
jgi:hypothetical protein